VNRSDLAGLPKVVLHEHLDGGLRPATVIELARETGYRELPTTDPDDLAVWFDQGESGSLERYLEAFRHTVAVMQTPEALERVAAEAVEDLAADGVVYAELRFAPSLHMERGLGRRRIIEAVLAGLRREPEGCDTALIVDAMRQDDDSDEVVAAALESAADLLVGFDLAGPEAGFPASRHLSACRTAREGGLGITIHAGEGAGPESIADALDCGAERIGHGVRIVEDLGVTGGAVTRIGPIARRLLEDRIPLEVCPTSNVHTRAFPSLAAHPVGLLHRAGFVVTLNTDNRLMSRTSMTDEWEAVVRHHGFGLDDLRAVTDHAVAAAFCGDDVRRRVAAAVDAGFSRTG
jgi:adenosine deaminase